MTLQDLYSEEVRELCRWHGAKQLLVYGSLVKGGFEKDSDIDLLVDFEPMTGKAYKDNYFFCSSH